MRSFSKIIIGVAALAMLSSTAYAGEPYIGVSGGVALPEDSENRGETNADIAATPDFDAIPSGTDVAWDTQLNTGYDIGLHAGYKFDNGFRAELQGYYTDTGVTSHSGLSVGGADIDAVDSAVLTRGAADAANPAVGAVLADGQGKIKSYGVMANGFYDFNKGGALQPYVGGGLGFQVTDVRFRPSGVDVANDDKTVFAYQLMAGATYKVGPSLELFGQYTYRGSDRARVDLNLLPAELEVESKSSIFSLGVRVPFGGGK